MHKDHSVAAPESPYKLPAALACGNRRLATHSTESDPFSIPKHFVGAWVVYATRWVLQKPQNLPCEEDGQSTLILY